MRVKGVLGVELAALVSTMRSPFMGADRGVARGAGEVANGAGQRRGKSVKRKSRREDFIVFSAVASAYLLAWAASRVFQQ